MFWPNMPHNISSYVDKCTECATFEPECVREPMISHEIPARPWAKVAADFMDYGAKSYLVVVDYYSKYPEVIRTPSKKAQAAIEAMKSIFARHGIPDELVADNMPFDSFEFKDFTNEWKFNHTPSSPHYPRSNGQAERYVGIVKNFLRKAKDLHAALLQFRNTPIKGLKHSPAEMLMGRKLNDKLFSHPNLLQPNVPNSQEVHTKLLKMKAAVKTHYDKGSRQKPAFNVGDNVRYRTEGRGPWQRAVVTAKLPQPRSYRIQNELGGGLRRTSRHMRWSPDAPVMRNDFLDDVPDQPERNAQPEADLRGGHGGNDPPKILSG